MGPTPRASKQWLLGLAGAVVVLGLGLVWLQRVRPPAFKGVAGIPFEVVFHGPRLSEAETALRQAHGVARERWQGFTGEALVLSADKPLHFITQPEAMVPHQWTESGRTWEKFFACDEVVHFAPRYLTDLRLEEEDTDYTELQRRLERELLGMGLKVLRQDKGGWLWEAAIEVLQDERRGLLHPENLRRNYRYLRSPMSKSSTGTFNFCGGVLDEQTGECNSGLPSPWVAPLLLYVREAQGPQAARQLLASARKPEDLLRAVVPAGDREALARFEADFDAYLKRLMDAPPPR
jgi:hypothetical protein